MSALARPARQQQQQASPVCKSKPKRADGFGQWIERARIESQVRVSQSVKNPLRSLVYFGHGHLSANSETHRVITLHLFFRL